MERPTSLQSKRIVQRTVQRTQAWPLRPHAAVRALAEHRVFRPVARVVVADLVAVALLLVAAGIEWRVQTSSVRLAP